MRITTLGLLASLVLAGPAFAQTAEAVSESNSGAFSSSVAQGGTAVQGIFIDQRAPGNTHQIIEGRGTTTTNIRQSGTTTSNINSRQSGTVRSEFAPAVNAPAFSSGHPCGLADSLGISIIGGGVTGGSTHVDDACLLGQMGLTRPAIAIIAGRNPQACKALRDNGSIRGDTLCDAAERRAAEQAVGPVNATAVAQEPVCRIKPGTTRTVQVRGMSNADCARTLGL